MLGAEMACIGCTKSHMDVSAAPPWNIQPISGRKDLETYELQGESLA